MTIPANDPAHRNTVAARRPRVAELFVLCLYVPQVILWTFGLLIGEASLAEIIRGIVLTPFLPTSGLIRFLSGAHWDSSWRDVLAAAITVSIVIALARGVARTPSRIRIPLSTACGLLLAAWSVWTLWLLVSIVAAGRS